MEAQLETKDTKKIDYVEALFRASSQLNSGVEFIKTKQAQAADKLSELGFPVKSNEDWKYYDFSPVLEETYKLNDGRSSFSEEKLIRMRELVAKYAFPETTENLLVTVNGAFNAQLSSLKLGSELEILNFNDPEALAKSPEAKASVEAFFAKDLEEDTNFFKVANTALMTNGFLLKVHDNAVIEKTLQVLHISNEDTFNQTRSLIHMGKNSELKILVNYVGLDDAKYFTNAVIEAKLEANSKLKLDKIKNESKNAIQMYSLHAELERDSNFEFNAYSFKSKTSRDEVIVDINAENAHASVNGLYVVGSEKKSHHKVVVNHNAPHCTSQQLYKGLLYDKARAEFNGMINVAKAAQQTDAQQLNKNLLLSDEAHIDSRPQLDILADDVKCSHGSATGQLDEDELFYLQSRGMKAEDANIMLTYSFCDEIIKNIDLESARDYVSELAVRNLNESLRKELTTKKSKATSKKCPVS